MAYHIPSELDGPGIVVSTAELPPGIAPTLSSMYQLLATLVALPSKVENPALTGDMLDADARSILA